MKFGRILREKTLKEWRFYSVDYKAMKKALNKGDAKEFDEVLEASKERVKKFYDSKESWVMTYLKSLEAKVADLVQISADTNRSNTCCDKLDAAACSSTDEDASSLSSFSSTSNASKDSVFEESQGEVNCCDNKDSLKDAYRLMGSDVRFQAFIYCKKALDTFLRELDLLLEYLELNLTAFTKILKKSDKRNKTNMREDKIEEILRTHSFLKGSALASVRVRVQHLLAQTNENKPPLPEGWESRKVYTIGCFDLFHRGHQNVLKSLREFGAYIVAGIHDDASYYKLKKKYPIDTLEVRMRNVKPFVDQLYVIPSTDPLLYIQSVVSEHDVINGTCCYARGDDMLEFPARPWVESVMPVYFVPRTESCSSTLLRTMYHADCPELRLKAAFARTRYDGKPIDEKTGEVLVLNKLPTNQ